MQPKMSVARIASELELTEEEVEDALASALEKVVSGLRAYGYGPEDVREALGMIPADRIVYTTSRD